MTEDKIRAARGLNPATLAFLGDAVYELYIRERLTADGARQAETLHNEAVRYVCASYQARLFEVFMEELPQEERDILKRGRNAKTARVPKHSTPNEYRKATGVETLFGYLKISDQTERLNFLLDRAFNFLEEEKKNESKDVF